MNLFVPNRGVDMEQFACPRCGCGVVTASRSDGFSASSQFWPGGPGGLPLCTRCSDPAVVEVARRWNAVVSKPTHEAVH